jgi:hypothetical protein
VARAGDQPRRVRQQLRDDLERRAAHRDRVDARGRLEADRGDQLVELLGLRGASVDRDCDAGRDDVSRVRLHLDRPDGGNGRLVRAARDVDDELGRLDEGVVASVHRRRSGVVGTALEDGLSSHLAGDCRDDAERRAGALEERPLLDVQLHERRWKLAKLLAPHRPRLLGAEGDGRELRVGQPCRRLDRPKNPKRAVELPAVGDGVEMRATPDAR